MTDHRSTLALLRHVLPDERWADDRFLAWQYDDNPLGSAVEQNVDEGGQRVAHVAGLPIELTDGCSVGRFLLLVNVATASRRQREGHFVRLSGATIAHAAKHGLDGVFGVTNARSLPPALDVAGARMVGHLPVRLIAPWRGDGRGAEGGVVSRAVDADLLADPSFDQLAAEVSAAAAGSRTGADAGRAWRQRWTVDQLRWRLASPARRYAIHVSSRAVAISTRTTYRGVAMAIMLKLSARGEQRHEVAGAPLARAACRFHRAPVAVHAGWNADVRLGGPQLPQRWLPSPLALVYCATSTLAPTPDFELATFELLDFDAF